MTNDTKVPDRIWAWPWNGCTSRGQWSGSDSVGEVHGSDEYIRHDLHLALVAAAYEDAARKAFDRLFDEMCKAQGIQVSFVENTCEKVVKEVRALTPDDAQAARDARDRQVRKDALREAAAKAERIADMSFSPNTCATTGVEYSAGWQDGAEAVEKAILALIEKDKTDE